MELTRRFLLSWLLGGSLIAFFANLFWQIAKFLKPPQELISGGGGGRVTVIPLADLPVDHAKVVP